MPCLLYTSGKNGVYNPKHNDRSFDIANSEHIDEERAKQNLYWDLSLIHIFCRAKADWLVGINATRLFSVLYHRTLNIGRVMSPTLALIVQREAEIDTFKPVPFYTVALELPGLRCV